MNSIKINLLGFGEMKSWVGSYNSVFFMRIDIGHVSFQFKNGTFKKVEYFREVSMEEEASPEFHSNHYLTMTRSIVFGIHERHKSGSHGQFSEKTLKDRRIHFDLNRHITNYHGDSVLDIPVGLTFEKVLTTEEFEIIKDALALEQRGQDEHLIETRLKDYPRNGKLLDCQLSLNKQNKTRFKASIEKKSKLLSAEIFAPEKNTKIILEKKLTDKEIEHIKTITSDQLTAEVIKKVIGGVC